ncbi:hypothetical protein DPMN_064226 [Dreissena polymorpha]|uniref:Uncharacterized protein n=1 Tax=Dreissena polymorpha TaxID=45954 RepID=A0A9D4CCZ2_DREPO|nr:hypothetical protein DPMN_064226 [Dreissena polymorpha]
MDLQYLTDVYPCIMYIVSYITKDEGNSMTYYDMLANKQKRQAYNSSYNNLVIRFLTIEKLQLKKPFIGLYHCH